jgi:hypothetical protein
MDLKPEYKILRVSLSTPDSIKSAESQLNSLAKDGWILEFVATGVNGHLAYTLVRYKKSSQES